MKFKAGDKARIIHSRRPERTGMVVTVAGACPWEHCPREECYELDLIHGNSDQAIKGHHAHYPAAYLDPVVKPQQRRATTAHVGLPLSVKSIFEREWEKVT